MALNFIDISNHQSTIRVRDVPTAAVIVKATEGRGWRDRSMPGFVAQARAADKPVGFYPFVSQGNTPVQEADNFLSYTEGHRRDNDLLALDWEPIGNNPSPRDVDWAVRWLEYVSARVPNPLWTYMNLSTANGADWRPVTSRWPLLWLAHYPGNNRADGYNPAGARGQVSGSNEWQLAAWQFTDRGRLPGFGGNLDLNELYIPWWTGRKDDPFAPRTETVFLEIPPLRESDPPVDLVDSEGRRFKGCICQKLIMPIFDRKLVEAGLAIRGRDVMQGGYRTDVAASANTHAMGGVEDIRPLRDIRKAIEIGQRLGIILFWRDWTNNRHFHLLLLGCPHQHPEAEAQLSSSRIGYLYGKDGLARPGAFYGPRGLEPKGGWQEAYRAETARTVTIRGEDPVPDFVRYVEEFDHRGVKNADDPDTGWELPPKDQGVVVAPRARRLKIDANAIIHVPDGVTVRTRWVSWSGRDDPGWVRGPARRHESNEAETVWKAEQAWPGADLRLDVWTDKPCRVRVEASAWVWELD